MRNFFRNSLNTGCSRELLRFRGDCKVGNNRGLGGGGREIITIELI